MIDEISDPKLREIAKELADGRKAIEYLALHNLRAGSFNKAKLWLAAADCLKEAMDLIEFAALRIADAKDIGTSMSQSQKSRDECG